MFLKTLHRITAIDLGFVPERLMAYEFSFPRSTSDDHKRAVAMRSPWDPWVLGVAAVLMLAVSIAGAWLPTARAAAIDPNRPYARTEPNELVSGERSIFQRIEPASST
ncbi:MAG TPA: hypothetical protein DEH78_12920 [Solibacterales bacterium]|nr:hypothetical protein [Bryobacterales bacterium]